MPDKRHRVIGKIAAQSHLRFQLLPTITTRTAAIKSTNGRKAAPITLVEHRRGSRRCYAITWVSLCGYHSRVRERPGRHRSFGDLRELGFRSICIGGVSVEILWKLAVCLDCCRLPFHRGGVYIGRAGTVGTFTQSAGAKEDGSGSGQNAARRPACEVAAPSFHSAGLIERKRVSRYARRGPDREALAGV